MQRAGMAQAPQPKVLIVDDVRGNLLARGKALYKGHAVAAVAAVSGPVAEEAARLIELEYEPLPNVTSAVDAMRDDAQLLVDRIRQAIRSSPPGPSA